MAERTAGAAFQDWLKHEIEPFLVARGWRGRGLVFERAAGENAQLLQFVRWKGSTAAHYDFWLEAAVFSPRVADEKARFLESAAPARADVGWAAANVRLAGLLGERTDVVWRLRADALAVQQTALGDVVRENIVAHVFPWLDAYTTDEQLRDWMLGRAERMKGPSLLELRRLVADLGPAEELTRVDALIAVWNARPPFDARAAAARWNPFAASDAEATAADAAMMELERLGLTERHPVE
jgi:hypothetical protein